MRRARLREIAPPLCDVQSAHAPPIGNRVSEATGGFWSERSASDRRGDENPVRHWRNCVRLRGSWGTCGPETREWSRRLLGSSGGECSGVHDPVLHLFGVQDNSRKREIYSMRVLATKLICQVTLPCIGKTQGSYETCQVVLFLTAKCLLHAKEKLVV